MKRYLLLPFIILALQGCASTASKPAAVADRDQEQMRAVHSDLVEEMIRQENYHAALAHIEELQRAQKADRLTLQYARVLYKLGRIKQAHAEYADLLGGPFDAEAMHGIGLIHAINDPRMSLDYLGKASRGKPTDAGIRNDYGYALLRQGEFSSARQHLTTAHELAPDDTRYRNNALLAMLVLNDQQDAERLARKTGVSPETLSRIRAEARKWQAGTAASLKQQTPPVQAETEPDASEQDDQPEIKATVAAAANP